MTVVERIAAHSPALNVAQAPAISRDGVIDAMRGIAILMVIGIHSLPQPLDAALGEIPRRGAAALRAGLPVRFRISDGAFRPRAAREAVKGGLDPLRNRVRRRLCLHGAA